MSELDPICEAIQPEISRALGVIGVIAQKQAEGRAASIRELSGGAIETTHEQLDAIAKGIQAELISELREQVRSTVTSYTAITETFKG